MRRDLLEKNSLSKLRDAKKHRPTVPGGDAYVKRGLTFGRTVFDRLLSGIFCEVEHYLG